MSRNIARLRSDAAERQSGRCWYCGCTMLPPHADSMRRCTAEHLFARQDDGRDTRSNIVAACHFCNQHRHRRKAARSPEQFRALVKARLRQGRWHGFIG